MQRGDCMDRAQRQRTVAFAGEQAKLSRTLPLLAKLVLTVYNVSAGLEMEDSCLDTANRV